MQYYPNIRLKFFTPILFLFLFIGKANAQTTSLVCNQPLIVFTDANTCNKVVRYNVNFYEPQVASLTYSFSGATTGSGSGTGTGSVFNIGTTNVFFTATLPGNNIMTCASSIIVKDTLAPVFNCSASKVVNSAAGKCGAIVDYALPTVIDNCTSSNSNKKVLMFWAYQSPDNDILKAALEAAGFIVTLSDVPNSLYDGTNPSLSNFDAAVDITGTVGVMPAAGQSALVDFVTNKGKIFVSSGYHPYDDYSNQSYQTMNDIVPLEINAFNSEYFGTNYILNPSQISTSYLTGIPSSFTGPTAVQLFTTLKNYTTNPAISLITTEFPSMPSPNISCAFAVREFQNGGRAFCFNHLGDFSGTDIYSDVNMQHLYINALSRTDSIAVVQTAGLASGSLFPEGVTTNTFTATDKSGNVGTCSFTVTVRDAQNPTNYIIYATKEAKFGESNIINGDVGVTAADGKAEFEKNDVLNPNFVKAKSINVHSPALVSNKFYTAATGGPTPTFFAYNGNTNGLSNYTATTSNTFTGNYKELTINAGLTVTLTGNNFGKIEIKEGANVTFTGSAINVVELQIKKGTPTKLTTIKFANPTAISIKNKVNVEENTRVNEGGPKITFYLGDNDDDAEKFTVKGKNTNVTANIIIPKGKLKVEGSDEGCIMTGWYIIEKLESAGKNVQWNKNVCSGTQSLRNVPTSSFVQNDDVFSKTNLTIDETKNEFKVSVFPNPSSANFKVNIESKSNEPVTIRILDMVGKEINIIQSNKTKSSALQIGAALIAGTYFAEISQGSNKQIVKLVKLN
jgi:Secretion system C-terminal sorting domain/HYR domain